MNEPAIHEYLSRTGGILQLKPQIVGRFYGDGNRLGQRATHAPKPAYYQPERWIGSSTPASNPPDIPSGGVSEIAGLSESVALRDLLASESLGPALLGEDRFKKHEGRFLMLLKLLDAMYPIPFHVHADDAFVKANPLVYPNEQFGKDEAYHFLDVPKGDCPYTHAGLFPGVTAKDVIEAMNRSTDHVLELSPGALQNFGEGFFVKAGLLHRPGTALTLEIQQPSDVYTMFQTDFGGEPLAPEAICPGFDTIEEAAEAVVNWEENLEDGLLDKVHIVPNAVDPAWEGGQADWVFPPEFTDKFSGIRLIVETEMTIQVRQPCVLFVWRGKGLLDEMEIEGGGGPVGKADEFFLGAEAVKRKPVIKNTGDEPLVAFLMFGGMV